MHTKNVKYYVKNKRDIPIILYTMTNTQITENLANSTTYL